MRSLLFANLTTRLPATTEGGAVATFPQLLAGQQWEIALRFTEAVEGEYGEVRPAVRSLRASIGPVDARPTGGTFRLQVGAGASNTTTPLAYNATAAQVATALNALGQGGDYLVDYDAGSYLIRRSGGQQIALSVRQNVLRPISAGRLRAYQIDGGWVHELRLVQAPYAFADNAAQVLPDAPFVQTLVNGYTSPDNTWLINEVQQLVIPTTFRSSYRLTFDYAGGVANTGVPRKTRVLGVEDGQEELQTALNAILNDIGGYKGEVKVSNPTNNVARIEFGGEALKGADLPALGVEAFALPNDEGDWRLTLDLNRSETWVALRAEESVTVPFEVEADIYIDRNDLTQGWRTVKLWNVPVTIGRPLLFEGMAAAQNIDWLRPVSPQSYIPFNANQIITGQQHWVGTIGFGTAMAPAYGTAVSFGTAGGEQIFTIDHNLSSEAVHVSVRENTTPGAMIEPKRIRIEGPNSLSVAFGSALAAGQVYGVVITAAGPKSVFQAHTHPMAQVVGLEEAIGSLGERVLTLERLLPKAGAAGMDGGQPQEFTLPAVGEILPDMAVLDASGTLASQIVVGPMQKQDAPVGTDVDAQENKLKEKEKALEKDPDALPANVLYRALIPGVGKTGERGKDAVVGTDGTVKVPAVPEKPSEPAVWPARSAMMAKAGRWPMLLPAIEQSNVLSFGTASLLPEASQSVGSVWVCTNPAGVDLPGGGGRKGQMIKAGERFGSDGRALYRVNVGANNVYYPAEMDRELWRVFLGPDQFAEGAVLSIAGELRTRMLGDFFDDDARGVGRVDVGAQYMLMCEAVPVFGTALAGQVSSPIVLGATRITLSPALETFQWSLSIRREATAMVSAWTAYRKSMAGGNFALPATIRLRLTAFDMDDASPDPRGQVALIMPQTRLDITL